MEKQQRKGQFMQTKIIKKTITFLLILNCMILSACGSKQELKEETQEEIAGEEVVETEENEVISEYTQENYQKLAEENIELLKQYRELMNKSADSENAMVNESTGAFEQPDLMEIENAKTIGKIENEVLDNVEEITDNNATETKGVDSTFHIPVLEDNQLEDAILNLEEQNQFLQDEIEMLQQQLSLHN